MLFRYRIHKDSWGEYYILIKYKKSQDKIFWREFDNININSVCAKLDNEFTYEFMTVDYQAVMNIINRYDSIDDMINKYICAVINERKEYKVSEENKAKKSLDAIASGKWSNVIEINVEDI